MIFALGARFHKDPRIPISVLASPINPAHQDHAAGFEFFLAATGELLTHITPASLFDIQNSVLAVLYCLGATTPVTAWQVRPLHSVWHFLPLTSNLLFVARGVRE